MWVLKAKESLLFKGAIPTQIAMQNNDTALQCGNIMKPQNLLALLLMRQYLEIEVPNPFDRSMDLRVLTLT